MRFQKKKKVKFPEIKQYLSEDLDIEQGDLRI